MFGRLKDWRRVATRYQASRASSRDSANRLRIVTGDTFLKPPFLDTPAAQRLQRGWVGLQNELSSLSTRFDRVQAHGSGHFVQRDDPDLLADVILAVARDAATT